MFRGCNVSAQIKEALAAEPGLTDAAIAALQGLPRTVNSSKFEYRLFLELEGLGLAKLTSRTVRNNVAFYTVQR